LGKIGTQLLGNLLQSGSNNYQNFLTQFTISRIRISPGQAKLLIDDFSKGYFISFFGTRIKPNRYWTNTEDGSDFFPIFFFNSFFGYASVRPFLYFAHRWPPSLLRPKLYFDMYFSTNKKSRFDRMSKYRGRSRAVEVQKWSNWYQLMRTLFLIFFVLFFSLKFFFSGICFYNFVLAKLNKIAAAFALVLNADLVFPGLKT